MVHHASALYIAVRVIGYDCFPATTLLQSDSIVHDLNWMNWHHLLCKLFNMRVQHF